MESNIMPKVYGWMFIGLLITFLTGFVVYTNPTMIANVFGSAWLFIIVILEFVLVIFLSARISKMKPVTAKVSFILYSFVSGLTFSSVFITYELSSIMLVFLITALIFGIFAVIGTVTKKDLTKFGSYLLMALIGIIIISIVNLFISIPQVDFIISIIVIIVFVGFTAYDVQRIKRLEKLSIIDENNLAIYGALQLYLDFINIFLELLNLMGKRDN